MELVHYCDIIKINDKVFLYNFINQAIVELNNEIKTVLESNQLELLGENELGKQSNLSFLKNGTLDEIDLSYANNGKSVLCKYLLICNGQCPKQRQLNLYKNDSCISVCKKKLEMRLQLWLYQKSLPKNITN